MDLIWKINKRIGLNSKEDLNIMNYINTYFRDGKSVSYEEWNKMLKEDIEKENKYSSWNVSDAIHSDIGNGRDVEANDHDYSSRTDILYDSAKELFEDLMCDGQYDVIFDVLKEMSEEEIFHIVSKMKCVNIKDNKLLLKDEKDW